MDSLRIGNLESYVNAHSNRCHLRASDIFRRVGEQKTALLLREKNFNMKESFMKVFYNKDRNQIMQWIDINGKGYSFDSQFI